MEFRGIGAVRPLPWLVSLLIVVLVALGFGASTALAQPNPLPGSMFQGADGNQVDDSGFIDWEGLELDGRVDYTADPSADDDVFASGSKVDQPGTWSFAKSPGGANPAQDNILDFYRAFDNAPGQGGARSEDAFLYLAFTRQATTGDTDATFVLNQDANTWINQSRATVPCPTTGDLLISLHVSGNTPSVDVSRWTTETEDPSSGCARTGQTRSATGLKNAVDVQGAVNAMDIPDLLPSESGSKTLQAGSFVEAAIDITQVLKDLNVNSCETFGSTWMYSQSPSPTGLAMQDYVPPDKFTFATCKATPTLTSTASPDAQLSKTLELSDTAHISGMNTPSTGTLTFSLYGPNAPNAPDCSVPAVFTSTATATTNGDYESGSFEPKKAGTYEWVVSYKGDRNNDDAGAGDCGAKSETTTVDPATPTLTSTVSAPKVSVTDEISDTATLAGGVHPTGTITFKLYGPDESGKPPNCTGTPVFTSTEVNDNGPTPGVQGNGTYSSPLFQPTKAGIYHWVVSYSGDTNNAMTGPTACDDPNETVTVEKASPTLATVPSGSVQVKTEITDTARLIGASAPTGEITFELYGPDDPTCTDLIATSKPNVENGTAISASFTPTEQGTYHWVVSYPGDANNNAVEKTNCQDESTVVVPQPLNDTTLTTEPGPSQPIVGKAITDTATLTRNSAEGTPNGGTITFQLFGPTDASCSGPPVFQSKPENVEEGHASSESYTPTVAGMYHWIAHYSGDGTDAHSASDCMDEEVTVDKATPTLTTDADKRATVGEGIEDSATLEGGVHPGGTITFSLYGPNDEGCNMDPVYTVTLRVVGDTKISTPTFEPSKAGTYRWTADYSGDDNNAKFTTACNGTDEITRVVRQHPSLTTSASPVAQIHPNAQRAEAAGDEIYDSATLGGFRPTGSITFELFGPNDASCKTPIFTSVINVSGRGNYNSESFTPTESGTYRWVATYSSMSDNNTNAGPTSCDDAAESVRVTVPADPSLMTSASDAVTLGGAIHDTATLAGGSTPTGTITFSLYSPSDAPGAEACSANPVFTSTVPVNGNGAYTSGSFTPSGAGAYRWVATYSGDTANRAAATACRDAGEATVVRPPGIDPVPPSLSTTTSASGNVTQAVAHLSGGTDPTGALTFSLYGPNDATCSSPPVFTSVVPVDGNGDYHSPPFIAMAPGTYRWVTTYSGDALNAPVATSCSDPAATAELTLGARAPVPSPGPNEREKPNRGAKHKLHHQKPKKPPKAHPKAHPKPKKPPKAHPKAKPKPPKAHPKPHPPKPKPHPKPKPPPPQVTG